MRGTFVRIEQSGVPLTRYTAAQRFQLRGTFVRIERTKVSLTSKDADWEEMFPGNSRNGIMSRV